MNQDSDPRRLNEWEEVIGVIEEVNTIKSSWCVQINENRILLEKTLEVDPKELIGCEVALLRTDLGPVLEVKNNSK